MGRRFCGQGQIVEKDAHHFFWVMYEYVVAGSKNVFKSSFPEPSGFCEDFSMPSLYNRHEMERVIIWQTGV